MGSLSKTYPSCTFSILLLPIYFIYLFIWIIIYFRILLYSSGLSSYLYIIELSTRGSYSFFYIFLFFIPFWFYFLSFVSSLDPQSFELAIILELLFYIFITKIYDLTNLIYTDYEIFVSEAGSITCYYSE